MHLRPNGGVDAVGANQQCAVLALCQAVCRLGGGCYCTVIIVFITSHPCAQTDRIRTGALYQFAVEQHVELAAVHGVLRPFVTGLKATCFGIDILAIHAHQCPFERRQAHLIQLIPADAQVEQFPYRVRLDIDADTKRTHLPDRFKNDRANADLV